MPLSLIIFGAFYKTACLLVFVHPAPFTGEQLGEGSVFSPGRILTMKTRAKKQAFLRKNQDYSQIGY